MSNWIQTFSGKKLDPLNPQPQSLDIESIVHALTNVCRWGGHCKIHWSVAQHSILVSDILRHQGHSEEIQFWGLMHDAAEAYLGDVCRPVKKRIGFEKYESPLLKVILRHVANLSGEIPEVVHQADNIALVSEANLLFDAPVDKWTEKYHIEPWPLLDMRFGPEGWKHFKKEDGVLAAWRPGMIKSAFFKRFGFLRWR